MRPSNLEAIKRCLSRWEAGSYALETEDFLVSYAAQIGLLRVHFIGRTGAPACLRVYPTTAALTADLAHDVGAVALGLNGTALYVKGGASGAGAWTATPGFTVPAGAITRLSALSADTLSIKPWAAYSPGTPTPSGSGSFTTANSSGGYQQVGNQVDVEIAATVANIGNGAGDLVVNLPVPAAGTFRMIGVGYNYGTGKPVIGVLTNDATKLNIKHVDGTSVVVNGANIVFAARYRAA